MVLSPVRNSRTQVQTAALRHVDDLGNNINVITVWKLAEKSDSRCRLGRAPYDPGYAPDGPGPFGYPSFLENFPIAVFNAVG